MEKESPFDEQKKYSSKTILGFQVIDNHQIFISIFFKCWSIYYKSVILYY